MISYILRGSSPAATANYRKHKLANIAFLSSVTEGELRYGLARNSVGRVRRLLLEELLADADVLSWGRPEAWTYGTLRAEQERTGLPLAPLDMMIAAHAVSVGAVLVTHDAAFRQVRGLEVEDWATDL